MQRLGYRPSPVARALSRRRTDILEVILPSFNPHRYVEVLRGIEEAIVATNYALIVRSVERGSDPKRILLDAGAHDRVDGILLASLTPTDRLLDLLAERRMPIVLVDCTHPRLPSVIADYDGAAVVVAHLRILGHRRIGVLNRPDEPWGSVKACGRSTAYRLAMEAAELPFDPAYHLSRDDSAEGGRSALEHFLGLPEPPTAVAAASDMQAIGVLDGARRHGRAVPDEIAVVGEDGIEFASYLDLTTVRVPMRAMGCLGARMLLGLIEGESPPVGPLRLPVDLVVRGSTRRPSDD
jgi:DNA-binding LacI/PurR family transcriptional regulator